MAAGIKPPSQLLKTFAAYPRQHGLALALREIGRINRTQGDIVRRSGLAHLSQQVGNGAAVLRQNLIPRDMASSLDTMTAG